MNSNQWNKEQGNQIDEEYNLFLMRLSDNYRIKAAQQPIFMTDVDADKLWQVYLQSFPLETRQTHNCNACRHFIQRFGGLVTIDSSTGETKSAFWDLTTLPTSEYDSAVTRLKQYVERAKVVSPFYSPEAVLGQGRTGKWTHLHARNPVQEKDAHPATAAKRQDFIILKQSLKEFNINSAKEAVRVLDAAALPRSERFVEPAKWFLDLHQKIAGSAGRLSDNLIWLAVANAPAGFTHVRSSMIGTLLEDIEAGLGFDDIKGRFMHKVDPAFFQRSQKAPSAAQIAAAEKIVQDLGIAPAFERRYTHGPDLEPGVIWEPTMFVPSDITAAAKKGVFDHLKPQAAAVPELDIPAKKMTWEKFCRDVMPGAAMIEYRVPVVGRFCSLTTAVHAEAPNILQWNNPVSWSFPYPAANCTEWNLLPRTLAKVEAIVTSPNMWSDWDKSQPGNINGKGAFLLLQGAKDTRGLPGGGLFVEHLKSDLKPYRATIEAHLNRTMVNGVDDPMNMAFGIGLMAGTDFTETAAAKVGVAGKVPKRTHVLMVLDDSGSMKDHLYGGRQAAASLAAGIQGLPGEVDVTVVRFGSEATTVMSRASKDKVLGIERVLRGLSGGTALNDTLYKLIEEVQSWPDANDPDTVFFLGIMTDGRDEGSRHFNQFHVKTKMAQVQGTGRWTIAFAGAQAYGYHPAAYADSIGVPPGNVKVFANSDEGFEEAGMAYSISTQTLAQGYTKGLRSTTTFFAATTTHEALGTDHPVLVVTTKSGTKAVYEIDRWD